MKKAFAFIRRSLFLIVFIVLFIAAELWLTENNPIINSGLFWLDDFEVTRRDHPEAVWDKVIFGSSELISGYLEQESSSGYVNLGVDYGVITDLYTLLTGGYIEVGSELVLALNWCSLYDELDTNPTYIWHKKWYEPYFYFQRDRLSSLLTSGFDRLLRGESFIENRYDGQTKIYYYGRMTEAELDTRMKKLDELFWSNGARAYTENLEAMRMVFDWCAENGIRVRALWLPSNPDAEMNPVDSQARELARLECREAGVEFYDMTGMLEAECFYDNGHMNKEYGAVVFTALLDGWLTQ